MPSRLDQAQARWRRFQSEAQSHARLRVRVHFEQLKQSSPPPTKCRSEWHEKVARYRAAYPSDTLSLFHAMWHFNAWSSWDLNCSPSGKVRRDVLAAKERQLIADYGMKFGQRPLLNCG